MKEGGLRWRKIRWLVMGDQLSLILLEYPFSSIFYVENFYLYNSELIVPIERVSLFLSRSKGIIRLASSQRQYLSLSLFLFSENGNNGGRQIQLDQWIGQCWMHRHSHNVCLRETLLHSSWEAKKVCCEDRSTWNYFHKRLYLQFPTQYSIQC